MDLPFGDRPVLHSLGHNEELTWSQPHRTVPKLEPQGTFQYEKELVFVLVPVPDELTLRFCQFDLLTVELPCYARVPVILDSRELLGEVDGFFLHACLFL